MKGMVSVLSSIFVGLMLAATNFAPILGLHRFLENRRRVMNAVMLFALSFFLMLGATILLSMDLVIQYEDQGLIFWNAILGIATAMAIAAVACWFGARSVMPKPREYLVVGGPSPLDQLQSLFTNMTSNSTSKSQTTDSSPQSKPQPSSPEFSSPLPVEETYVPPQRGPIPNSPAENPALAH